MNDPVISRFAEACGAAGPLDLQVDLADGGVLARGTVPMPFTLVGRDDACDVTLTDAEVNPRHAWLQVIGGQVFAADLGSRTGLGWQDGTTGSGWMNMGTPVRVGPFQVSLRSPVSPKPAFFPPGYNPLQSDPGVMKSRPSAVLEFRNGKRARDRWQVNRLLTIVGRAPECKIHLTAEDIAGYHCGLVYTTDGLWVVDLSGRGVVVNGERMRVSPLRHGAELWVGRFLIGVQYPGVTHTPALGRPGLLTPPTPLSGLTLNKPESPADKRPAPNARGSSGRLAPAAPAEDEVPLGVVPPPEPGNGLPSSHIMADAFRLWANQPGTGGPMSHPILVSGSGPTPPSIPIPTARPPATPAPPFDLFLTPPSGTPSLGPDSTAEAILGLLRQLGELHSQMFTQFQQSMVLMVQLFGRLRRDELPSVQRELARIQELNSELAQLQGEVARRAAEAAAPPTVTPPPTPRTGLPRVATPTPPPDSTALHDWVIDRINSLQRERQARWQSLVGMFTGKSA